MSEAGVENKDTGLVIHIICPLPNVNERGEFTVLCGLAPKSENFNQIGLVVAETAFSTSAAPAVVESTGYFCKWTQIDDKSIQNLARKLTNVVIPMLNQKLDLQIPVVNDQSKGSKSSIASTYIKMSCEQHRYVDFSDDRTTKFMQIPGFGETDKTYAEATTGAEMSTDTTITNAKIVDHQCPVCGHMSGKCIMMQLVEAICVDLRKNGVKITKDPLLGTVKPQALLFIN